MKKEELILVCHIALGLFVITAGLIDLVVRADINRHNSIILEEE